MARKRRRPKVCRVGRLRKSCAQGETGYVECKSAPGSPLAARSTPVIGYISVSQRMLLVNKRTGGGHIAARNALQDVGRVMNSKADKSTPQKRAACLIG
jgi:hypothetical protein